MTIPVSAAYRDRRPGLIVFGLLEILGGALCALVIPLMLWARALASRHAGAAATPPPPLALVGAVYGTMAVGLVWTGIGSMLCRRWARAIVVCASATGLAGGLIGCAVIAFLVPHLGAVMTGPGRPPVPAAGVAIAQVAMSIFAVVFYLVIPGVLFLFYRSPHVQRTCEVRDPVPRWTDRCPLPVLALSLLLGLSSVIVLGTGFSIRAFPIFGCVVTGAAATSVLTMMALLLLYLSVGLYRLRLPAWRGALAFYAVFAVSNIMTALTGGFARFYSTQAAATPGSQAVVAMLDHGPIRYLMVGSALLWIGWVLWIRRYFGVPAASIAS